MNKKQSQQRHFRRRVAERMNIRITKEGRRDIVRQIQGGTAQFWKRESCRISHWVVKMAGRQVIRVYDKARHVPVTVMPLEWATLDLSELADE
jgi:hypothetical protein